MDKLRIVPEVVEDGPFTEPLPLSTRGWVCMEPISRFGFRGSRGAWVPLPIWLVVVSLPAKSGETKVATVSASPT